MKKEEAPSGIVEVGNEGSWFHLIVKHFASGGKVSYKRGMP